MGTYRLPECSPSTQRYAPPAHDIDMEMIDLIDFDLLGKNTRMHILLQYHHIIIIGNGLGIQDEGCVEVHQAAGRARRVRSPVTRLRRGETTASRYESRCG